MSNENQTVISWTAPEFRYYQKTLGWYVALVAIALLLIVFFIFEKDTFAAVSMAILAVLVGLFSLQKPREVSIILADSGVSFGNIHFPYKQLKYFWIVNTQNHRTLNLEASTVINHTVIIEIMDEDEEHIRKFLLRHLQEHHQTRETFAQKVSHKLKF
jgi:uncharacterized membrane protein YobD (UPF0266 family)